MLSSILFFVLVYIDKSKIEELWSYFFFKYVIMVLYFILDRKTKEIFISFAQLIWYIINIKSYKIVIVDENYTKRNNENDTHRKKKHNKTELSIWLMIRRGATSTNDQIKLGKYISKVINNDI